MTADISVSVGMKMSSNGNIFRVIGHLCREFTGLRCIPRTQKSQWHGALMFSLICVSINSWVNNREANDLRRCRAHYEVTVMAQIYTLGAETSNRNNYSFHKHFCIRNNLPFVVDIHKWFSLKCFRWKHWADAWLCQMFYQRYKSLCQQSKGVVKTFNIRKLSWKSHNNRGIASNSVFNTVLNNPVCFLCDWFNHLTTGFML